MKHPGHTYGGFVSAISERGMTSGTTPSSKSSYLSPSGFTKHLRMGSMWCLHHILITWTELWGFFKSSALYLSVHMELRRSLSFYLRRSLRGYTVGTTPGFKVELMEALPHNLTTESHRSAYNTIWESVPHTVEWLALATHLTEGSRLLYVSPSLKAKTECIPLCVPWSSFTRKWQIVK
jgi:hypothetical protein